MYIYIYVWRIISPLPGRSCCGAHDSLSQLSVDPAKVTDLLTSAQRVQIGQQWTQQHPQTKEPQNSWEHHPFKEIQDGDFRIIIYILDIIYIYYRYYIYTYIRYNIYILDITYIYIYLSIYYNSILFSRIQILHPVAVDLKVLVVESAHGDPTVAWTAEDRRAVTALGLGCSGWLSHPRPAKSSRKRCLTLWWTNIAMENHHF
jgi:hypothetical protein